MRQKNPLNLKRALPCMSWSPKNLYNVWRRTMGPDKSHYEFKHTHAETIFQQRWRSKAAVRAYHGDFIPEKSFKRWYLPDTLPDVRPRRQVLGLDDKLDLAVYASRKVEARKAEKKLEAEIEQKGMAPVGSLMFMEVERRLDVFVFRCCFVHSVYEARRLIIHGYVKLNEKKHNKAYTRLAPGDMVSVDPNAIRFLKPPHGEVDSIIPPRVYKPPPPLTDEDKNVITIDFNDDEIVKAEEDDEGGEDEAEENLGAAVNVDADDTKFKPGSKAEADIEAETDLEAQANAEADIEVDTAEADAKVEADADKSTETSTSKEYEGLTHFHLPLYASPWLYIPAYIEVSFATCSAVYVRHPTARPGYSEIPTPYDADGTLIRYAWEWYMKRRPRMRSKAQLSKMPEDRVVTLSKSLHEDRRMLYSKLDNPNVRQQ